MSTTIGELKARVSRNRRLGGAGGMSIVNPSLTKDQALDIFERALAGHKDDDIARPLMVRNVERECPR